MLVAAWIATAALLGRRTARVGGLLVAGALFFPLYLNLERGQIDLLLLLADRGRLDGARARAAAGGLFALAAAFKPALLGVLPVLAALRRWRWLGAALGWCAVFGVVMLAVSGPSLVREYGATVLPRALLYGEGGSDEMAYHERDLERVFDGNHDDTQSVDGRSYHYALPFFDRPVSASLPRLLAPRVAVVADQPAALPDRHRRPGVGGPPRSRARAGGVPSASSCCWRPRSSPAS